MTCRILILEDVPFDVELMEREIRLSGIEFTSMTVDNEKDYLEALENFKPHVILADHSLPSFDGLSALKIALERCPNVPFIFVSGKIGEEFAVEALKRGATDYVLKSNFSKVPIAIKRALREVEKQKELERARKSLIKSHWQLREAQRIGKIGSWHWDMEADRLSCSEEGMRILGIKPDEFSGSIHELIDRIHPDDREDFRRRVMSMESFEGEYRALMDDGSMKILLFRAKVIRGPGGNPETLIGIKQDVTEEKMIRESLEASLREKEFLLSEVHHRVKNNLQLISSLLRLQSRYIDDEKSLEIFGECQNRVKSIALVHEKLYGSRDNTRVNLREYLEELVNEIRGMCNGKNIIFNLQLEDMDAEIDVAVSIGLIVNELVTNSIRHGISHEGAVTVKLEIMDDGAILKVSDTGKGLPEGFDIDESQGFGLRLVRFMLERINGSISLEDGDGCNFVVTFRKGGL